MADAPARALVIYGDAVLPALTPHHTSIHALAASGCCGFLALRDLQPSVNGAHRVVAELAQLLDVQDLYTIEAREEDCKFPSHQATEENAASLCMPSMSDRFMGIKAAMLTNSSSAGALGKRAGFTVSLLEEIDGGKTSGCSKISKMLPDPAFLASKLLNLLNFGEATKELQSEKETPKYELLLLHVLAQERRRSANMTSSLQTESKQVISFNENLTVQLPTSIEVADWLDLLLANVKHLATPGSSAAKHCYLVLVLGYGTAGCQDNLSEQFPLLEGTKGLSPELLQLRPRQSYSMKGGQLVNGIRNSHPLLAVHQLESVTRCDLCGTFEFNEFQESP
ncbi:hypothetical protein O6H91_11G061000 [Diphasiastrum complanatum]|uniref:Uncharacterized protein n=1 Tax=Diphasiastrum complanatum TaxID=34168 RepID=A0ACC2C9M6_DIPCM|nr:hypothetical protein O6H91_11G061000 [Diphasiastrum complanatum]